MTANSSITDIAKQQGYYDERWKQQEFANSLQAARCAAVVSVLSRIGIHKPQILDMGCGTGWLSAILGQFGPTTAVDLSEFAATTTAKRFPWVRFMQGDIFEWYKTQSTVFDVVVSQEVIEHVADQTGYLEIASGLLKDRGWLILTTPNARTVRALRNPLAWSNQPIEKILTVGALRRLVSRQFQIVEIGTIVPSFGEAGIYRLLNSEKLARLLDLTRLRNAYRRALLSVGFGLHTVVLARKK
jgi:2-polyprenyl-3-methyl-5-hydroxy-6-metoxy-1,4-benzoquinol methylase